MYFRETSSVPHFQRHEVRVTDKNNDVKIINHCLPEIGNRDVYSFIGFGGGFFLFGIKSDMNLKTCGSWYAESF